MTATISLSSSGTPGTARVRANITLFSSTTTTLVYDWYEGTPGPGFPYQRQTVSVTAPGSVFSDMTAATVPGNPYSCVVSCLDSGGNASADNFARQDNYYVQTTPPSSVTLSGSSSNLTVSLSWTGSTGATGYRLYRDGGVVGDTTATTFSESRSAGSTSYQVQPYTDNAQGRTYGAVSNTVTVTTNQAPNAPTLTTLVGGTVVNRAVVNRAAHTHSDPDGQGQSAFRLRYRLVGAGTWTTLADQVTTNQFYDFPASSLTAGDYERQVSTADPAGTFGPFSASGFFTAAVAPSGPTITDPINGQTIPTSSRVVTFSYPSLQAWEWRVLGDLAGAADTSNVLTAVTTGVTADRTFTISSLVNGTTVHPQVRVQVGGLWSAWTDSSNPVSFTPPATPTVALTVSSATASIAAVMTDPTPSGLQPTVTSHDVLRRVASVGGVGIRIAKALAPGVGFTDWTPASGVAYEYAVRSYGSNGTSVLSAWTSVAAGESTGSTGLTDFVDADFVLADFN